MVSLLLLKQTSLIELFLSLLQLLLQLLLWKASILILIKIWKISNQHSLNLLTKFLFMVLCLDDPALQDIIPQINKKIITYGLTVQADLRATDIEFKNFTSSFNVKYYGEELGRLTLKIPGIHNVKNSLVAVSIAKELGVSFSTIKKALESFAGVYRRFEVKYNKEIMVVDDYAHHPTETSASLAGIRSGWDRRLVAVFQPNLFSRTRDFFQEFGRSFLNSDVFICTDIYPAREEPIEGITGELIADAARSFGHKNVLYVENKNDIVKTLNNLKKDGDIIVTMGAGDIWKFGEKFVEGLNKK